VFIIVDTSLAPCFLVALDQTFSALIAGHQVTALQLAAPEITAVTNNTR